MWASQRAASNFTEIENLLVNTQYTVRVSLPASRPLAQSQKVERWVLFPESSLLTFA